jgi:hypothetical protein
MPIVAIPQLFAILGQTNIDKIGEAIKAKYPNDHLALTVGQWLLVANGTAQDVSANLGITSAETGSAVIIAGTSYFGRGNPQIWEWLKSKLGAARA